MLARPSLLARSPSLCPWTGVCRGVGRPKGWPAPAGPSGDTTAPAWRRSEVRREDPGRGRGPGWLSSGVPIPGGCRRHPYQVTALAPRCSWAARSAHVDFPVCPNVGSHRPIFQSGGGGSGASDVLRVPLPLVSCVWESAAPLGAGLRLPAGLSASCHPRGGRSRTWTPCAASTSSRRPQGRQDVRRGTEAQRDAARSCPT